MQSASSRQALLVAQTPVGSERLHRSKPFRRHSSSVAHRVTQREMRGSQTSSLSGRTSVHSSVVEQNRSSQNPLMQTALFGYGPGHPTLTESEQQSALTSHPKEQKPIRPGLTQSSLASQRVLIDVCSAQPKSANAHMRMKTCRVKGLLENASTGLRNTGSDAERRVFLLMAS